MLIPLNLPVAYRLVEKCDGSGNDIPSLEGLFLDYDQLNKKIEGSWRSLETLNQWLTEDQHPFLP